MKVESLPIETVIVLNDFCRAQGGASRVAIDEAVALKHLGLRVEFLGAVGPICDELRDAGVSVLCLDQPELADATRHPAVALRAMWNQPAFRATRYLLARHDPHRTIVHLHGYTKALSTAPIVAARRAGFATICTLHDFFAACPNGAFFNYRDQVPCELTALSPACVMTKCDKRHAAHKAYRVLRGAVYRHLARFPAGVENFISLSSRSAALLRPYLPPEAQLFPLPNIIDIERAPPVDVAASNSLFVVGRLDEEKGVTLAARAAAAAGMPIVFVGDGPLRSDLEACGARVTGWVTAAEVRRELSHARCLVFPSLWYETFGLVVSEAAALGVPAIVSDISAAADRVTRGRNGWVFRSGDHDDLTMAMRGTRSDVAVRNAGLAAWHDHWARPADRTQHANDLLAIYTEIISGTFRATEAASAARALSSSRVRDSVVASN